MNIAEMHVWFRQYAQQMGMQNVRAILPEQIDLLINTSITDTVNQLIRENVGITNDRIVTDNSKIGQINALRNLYKVDIIEMSPKTDQERIFYFWPSDRLTGKMTTKHNSTGEDKDSKMPDYLYLVDFSLNYKKTTTGYEISGSYEGVKFETSALETNFFPVRIIDDAYLADTLNDFVLKNRIRTPIIVIYNKDTYDLYIDKFTVTNGYYTLQNGLIPYQLRVSYIAPPAKVQYSEDINGTNIDCDLPDYMHIDILKHAVDLFRIAVSGSLHASQQQEQAQQQENVRNNYRNEGYQQ